MLLEKALNATLTQAQEAKLVDYIEFLDTKSNKVRLHEVNQAANKILYHAGQDRTVSRHFLSCFLKQHPDFLVQKQKLFAVAQKNAHDLDAMLKRFHEYKNLRREYDILDDNVWNFDETRFRIRVSQAQLIITRDAHRKLIFQDPDNREFLTSIESINVIGKTTPLYMILNGRQFLEKWFEATDLSENASFNTSNTGYSNDRISMD